MKYVKQKMSVNARVMTLKELCNYLNLHQVTVYRLLKAKQLPAFKVGRDWRFNLEAIDRWRFERESNSLKTLSSWGQSAIPVRKAGTVPINGTPKHSH